MQKTQKEKENERSKIKSLPYQKSRIKKLDCLEGEKKLLRGTLGLGKSLGEGSGR